MSNTNDSVCQFPNVGDSENLAPRATYIIGFEPSVDVNSLALGVRNILARGNPDNPPLQSLHMAISELTEDEVSSLQNIAGIDFIEPDITVQMYSTQLNPPWHLDRIDQDFLPLDKIYFYGNLTGKGTHIYIVDSGIRVDHPDFEDRAKQVFDAILDGKTWCNEHGTHVGSLAAGKTFGVAKQAQVYSLRVLDCSGLGTLSVVVRAIDWVIANGMRPGIINLSLGAPGRSDAMKRAVETATRSGFLVIAASGNEQRRTDLATCENQIPDLRGLGIKVAATTVLDQLAEYSNIGSCVDIYAPGSQVRGADPNTNDAIVLSGTSMASPIVSGIAAALWSRSPQLPVAAIRKLVLDSAIPGIVTGITNSSWPNRLANLPSDISSVPLVPDTPDVDKSPVPFVANPRQGNLFGTRFCGQVQANSVLEIRCPPFMVISSIIGSFGFGRIENCDLRIDFSCHSPKTNSVIESCLGRSYCLLSVKPSVFGVPQCDDLTRPKTLSVVGTCSSGAHAASRQIFLTSTNSPFCIALNFNNATSHYQFSFSFALIILVFALIVNSLLR